LKSPDEADAYIDDQIKAGADYIKILQESGSVLGMDLPVPTPELQKAVIDAAHRRGLKAVAHAQSLRDTILVLEAGIDGMAHTFCDEPPTDELISAYKKNNAWCCATLSAFGSLTATRPDIMKAFTDDQRVKELLTDQERDHLGCCMGGSSHGSIDLAVQSVKALRRANIDIVWYVCTRETPRSHAWTGNVANTSITAGVIRLAVSSRGVTGVLLITTSCACLSRRWV